MSTGAIVSMIIILTVVVGGFLYFLTRAIKKERKTNG
ncbi:MetS family NSS transporter small subunit [Ekhidna sp.]